LTVVVIKFVFTLYITCLGLALELYLVIQHFCCQSVQFSSVQFSHVMLCYYRLWFQVRAVQETLSGWKEWCSTSVGRQVAVCRVKAAFRLRCSSTCCGRACTRSAWTPVYLTTNMQHIRCRYTSTQDILFKPKNYVIWPPLVLSPTCTCTTC